MTLKSNTRYANRQSRDGDSSRFDTAKLQTISKDMLTCDDLESYMVESIKYGYCAEESEDERKTKNGKKSDARSEAESIASKMSAESSREGSPAKPPPKRREETGGSVPSPKGRPPLIPSFDGSEVTEDGSGVAVKGGARNADERWKKLAKRWVWGGMAGLSLGLGMGCFLLARRMKGGRMLKR